MKKLFGFAIGLLLVVGGVLVGCGGGATTDDGGTKEEPFKVGLALAGPSTDGGFNQNAYDGLKLVEKELGAEVQFNENTKAGDYEKILRDYAKDGCNLVIGNGFQFNDAAAAVASEYPDVDFIVISSTVENGENLGSIMNNTTEAGFLKGAFASYMTESKKVGAIAGEEITPMVNDINGFKAGSAYADTAVEVLTATTGSNDDAGKVKEQAMTFIDQGADYIMTTANAAGRGGYEAAAETGKHAIATNRADYAANPAIIACGEVYTDKAVLQAAREVKDGNFQGQHYDKGIADEIIVLTYNPSATVPDDVKKKIDDIVEKVKSGELKIAELVKK